MSRPRIREILFKHCKKCNKTTEFYTTEYLSTGKKLRRCKECSLRYTKEKVYENKKKLIELSGGKCKKCNRIDIPLIYDFHHIDPNSKNFNICKKLTSNINQEILEEVKKCELLCCICHRIEEHKFISCHNTRHFIDGLAIKRAGQISHRKTIIKFCTKCNKKTEFWEYKRTKCRRGTGPDSRCKLCCYYYSRNKLKTNKELYVKLKGGKCTVCSIVEHACVYDFHHLNPNEKIFQISEKMSNNIIDIIDELKKCILLCCLCHRKLENGLISLTTKQIEDGLKIYQ